MLCYDAVCGPFASVLQGFDMSQRRNRFQNDSLEEKTPSPVPKEFFAFMNLPFSVALTDVF